MAAACTQFPVDLVENTLGAYLIGVVVSATLYGITVVQSYSYLKGCERDPMWLKITVFILWVLDTFHQILLIHSMYHYMIIEYGNPLSIVIPLWSFSAAVIVSAVMEITMKSLFCYRLWRLGKRWILVLPIGILAFCEFVTTIVFIALGIAQKSFNANGTINGVFYAGAGSAAAADIILASSLAIILWRRQTGFQKTDTVLKTLIIYSINTCALTCLVSITSIITFASLQSSPSLVYVAFYHQLPTLLFNALLATYNSRQDLRNAVVAKGEAVNIPLCDVSIRPRGVSYYASCGSDSRGIHISVDKSQSTKVDTCATFGSIETSTNRQSDGFNHEKD